MARIGGRRGPSSGALTATESAIAELVAAGRTNDEVAVALSLSPRTVQWNLSKIYRKLGVRSRTELAAARAARPAEAPSRVGKSGGFAGCSRPGADVASDA